MIKLPNYKKSFEYENNFYLSSESSRIGKLIIQYELFKIANKLPGAIIECGVFKGNSLIRFATFRNLSNKKNRRIIGFDTFGSFPTTKFNEDQNMRKKFIKDAGKCGISKEQLIKILKNKKIFKNISLVKGNITKTVPDFIKSHPNLKIAMLNLDVDIYEPSKVILESLYPKIVKGGILILDDYKIFPGETKAVNDYFKNKKVKINSFQFQKSPKYIIKK